MNSSAMPKAIQASVSEGYKRHKRRRVKTTTLNLKNGSEEIFLTFPGRYRAEDRENTPPTDSEMNDIFAAAVFALVEKMAENPAYVEPVQRQLALMGLPRTFPLISSLIH